MPMQSHTITIAELRALREFASEDKSRESCYGVALLDDGRAAATDGHSGAILGVDPNGTEDPMHRPLILSPWWAGGAPLISLAIIDRTLKGAPAKSRIRWSRTESGDVLVERLSTTGAVEVSETAMVQTTSFPPLWQVCGTDGHDKPTGQISVSSVLLARLAVIERALSKNKAHPWSLRFGGPLDVILASPEQRFEGRPWIVAVMPIRM